MGIIAVEKMKSFQFRRILAKLESKKGARMNIMGRFNGVYHLRVTAEAEQTVEQEWRNHRRQGYVVTQMLIVVRRVNAARHYSRIP